MLEWVLASAVLVGVPSLLFVWREKVRADAEQQKRALALEERKVSMQETEAQARRGTGVGIPPMPPVLLQSVGAWRDEWAQAGVAARYHEMFNELGDWDKVMDVELRQSVRRSLPS